jgi:hypothetical protein
MTVVFGSRAIEIEQCPYKLIVRRMLLRRLPNKPSRHYAKRRPKHLFLCQADIFCPVLTPSSQAFLAPVIWKRGIVLSPI